MRRRLLLLARSTLAGALLAGMTPRAGASQDLGGVEGRVVDAQGRPVPSVEVLVERSDGTTIGRDTTDASGAWRITGLPAATYLLMVHRAGYRQIHTSIQVESGQTTRVTLVLELVSYTLDSLVVSGQPLSVSTKDPELSTTLTVAEISVLPTTLELRQLIALTPGARPDQIWGGASDQANSYSLDGTNIDDPGRGGAIVLPSPTWVQSLEVRGLGAGADVGGAQGGVVEVRTLEGGDVLHGGLRTSVESHRLNGTNLIPGDIGSELASRLEVDGQVRGPLIHDRLYFALFGDLVAQEERIPNYLFTRTGEFVTPAPTHRDYRWLAKATWRPGARDTLWASLLGERQVGERVAQTGYEANAATERLRQSNVTGNLTWHRSWSAASVLSVRFGGYVAREQHEPYGGTGLPGIELLTRVNPPSYQNAPVRTGATPSSLGFTASWTRGGRLAGLDHELKLGGEYTRGWWSFESLRNGGMTWRPQHTVGFDSATPATWVYYGAIPTGAIPTSWGGEVRLYSDVTNSALFLQEGVSIRPGLRLNPGIRLGWWTGGLTPMGGRRFTAVRDHALEPRVGLVAVLDPQGAVVAKAHWGRYHQPMFAALFDRVEGGGVYSDEEIWSYLGPAPATSTRTFTLGERDSLAALGLFRLDETNQLDQTGRVEHYRQPYIDQLVLSEEVAFGSRWKAGVVYVWRRNHDMVALVDRSLTSNYTVVRNVVIRDRYNRPVFFGGGPLVLDVAISNEDILRVRELRSQGRLLDPRYLYTPPDLTAAELAALRYAPDLALTNVPEATRRFSQLQLRLEARYPRWWGGAWATLSKLEGNINVVTGPDDYTTGGPGPWVRLNEQYNFFGALNNQSGVEGKVYLGGLLPAHFRGGASFSYATGDRVTPTMLIDPLLSTYAVTVQSSSPGVRDTLTLYPGLFQSVTGHRIFIQPRGTYRYETRASLDLHVERSFPRGRSEVIVALDGFNVLGDGSVTGIQTVVNTLGGLFDSDYGRVVSRIPPRTLRITAGVRF